jgi:hypothetical protein
VGLPCAVLALPLGTRPDRRILAAYRWGHVLQARPVDVRPLRHAAHAGNATLLENESLFHFCLTSSPLKVFARKEPGKLLSYFGSFRED